MCKRYIGFAFAKLGCLNFGIQIEGFRAFQYFVYTLFLIILGSFDFPALQQAHRALGPIFFLTYFRSTICILSCFYLNIPNRQDLTVFTEKFQDYVFADNNDRARRVTPETLPESCGMHHRRIAETESQPPNIPATPPNSNASSSPNSNNNNSMQLITKELKELNKKMDTMITMSEKMITMTNKLFYIQIGMLSLLVVTIPTAALYM
ncbi:unnamed protein product [Adineta steineri]|uniref:Polycystin cation channel PKD1/PKD2 domain-containing protein n=1 Tax=Adineta steineri TaxID=433720 RepID=A0A816FRX2_9BILA|nr:unnamed protein product [Adineta steineri]CAF1561626.1 unnamed protein product [Adineta steineri]CAF1665010.1 unnamed protein product [Adineta steineri]CAF1665016.1 unnamed protein product [Adineta steineri]